MSSRWLPVAAISASAVPTTTAAAATIAATTATASATTTTIAAATTTASTAVAPAATTTGRTVFTRTRFIHRQRATVKGLAVELRDRILRIGIAAHGHEREAARFAGEFVLHQHHFGHGTGLREIILEISLRRVEGEISNVEFVAHVMLSVGLSADFGDGSRKSVSSRH